MSLNTQRTDDWLLDDDITDQPKVRERMPWKVLIADDEPDVHSVTRLALRNIEFHGRKLELISAYSATEAFEILSQHHDIAVLLLDVVMETDDAGLRLVHRIRQELGNALIRIVLRTGQPGQAPEQEVIVNYDINDYKAKTELTTQKLFTTVISSLRSYESLFALENHRQGLHKIIKASSNLYHIESLRDFSSGLLKQINALLNIGLEGSICIVYHAHEPKPQQLQVIACTGSFENLADLDFLPTDHATLPLIEKALATQSHVYEHPNDVLYVAVQQNREFIIYLSPSLPLSDVERSLLEVFCDRMSLAFDNLWLNGKLQGSQMTAVTLLSGLAENNQHPQFQPLVALRQKIEEFALAVKQRGIYAEAITPLFVQQIGMAYMLHDLGKLAMNAEFQHKAGPLTVDERKLMQSHVQRGQQLLSAASHLGDESGFLTIASEIAYGHHEHFDGKGYPQGLQGTDIPLSARIAALFDVFEALINQRAYKKAWLPEEARAYIKSQAGKQFDPLLAEVFLDFI